MTCKVVNKTNRDMGQFTRMAQDLYPYSQKRLGFNKPAIVELHSDPQNASNVLGKTAHYDPSTFKIVVYTDNRHPKDILRSLSHELVHHAQNCRGQFDDYTKVGEGYAQSYAQKDKHLREMEKEAYLEGNMILRDWEDKKKENNVNEEKIREITRKVLKRLEENRVEERTKRDSPDRVAGRDTGGRRLKPLEEEENLEEVHEEVEVHNCQDAHPDSHHQEWAQQQAVGPVSHMGLNEGKTADQLHGNRLFKTLMKKWCK